MHQSKLLLVSCLLLCAFILILPSTLAAKQLDSRWVWPGDTFERDGRVYYAGDSSSAEQLLLYVDERPFILRYDECKDDAEYSERYCIEEAAYTNPETYESKIKYEYGEQLFGYRLVTYDYIPELTVTRSVNPTKAEYDRQSTVTIKFENTGEKAVTDIKYLEEIPESIFVFPIDSEVNSTHISINIPVLGGGGERVYQYAVKPQDYVSITMTPEITYAYEYRKKTASVGGITYSVPQPMTVTKTISSNSVAVDEVITYTVTVKNTAGNTMDVRAKIDFPEDIELESLDELQRSERTLSFEESIPDGKEAEFGFSFFPKKTGTYDIDLSVESFVNSKKTTRHYTDSITAKTTPIQSKLLLSKSNNQLSSGESSSLRVYLTNNDPNVFLDIDAELSGFLNKKITVNQVASGMEKLVAEIPFTAPDVDKTESETIHLAGSYQTKNGEQYTFKKDLTFTITPVNNQIVITHLINATTAAPGDSIKATVKIKNKMGKYLFLRANDILSAPVDLDSGTNRAEMSLENEAERQVYLYEFTIPETYQEERFAITTKVLGEDISQDYTTMITVTQPEIDTTSGEEAVIEESAPEEDNSIQEEEPGIFKRAWTWLKDFFS